MNARPPVQYPQAAYVGYPRPPPMPSAPPSAKRFKPTPPAGSSAAAAAAAAAGLVVGGDPPMTIEDEEDTSRGDILDHFTPREIAMTRYTQHHEWMEEVLGSAYSINRITPVDLGLGLRGELESVTKGLLDPPVYPQPPKPRINDPVEPPREKDPKRNLVELRARVDSKMAEIEAEMKRMEQTHAARLAKIAKTSVYKDAERDLRGGLEFLAKPKQPVGPDEGGEAPAQGASPASPVTPWESSKSIDDVVAEVEKATNMKIVDAKPVVSWELPVDVIVKMGGVVAAEGQQHGGGGDTSMNGSGDSFKLDIPTPDAPGLLDDFQQQQGPSADEPMMEDTIMADFMNVDDDLRKSASPGPAQDASSVKDTPAGEEVFALISEPESGKDAPTGSPSGPGEGDATSNGGGDGSAP